MAVVARPGDTIGVALLDLSTGEFSAAEYAGADGMQALADEMAVLKPREIVVPAEVELPAIIGASGLPVTPVDGWTFDDESARRTLLDQLRAGGLEGFGLDRPAGGGVGGRRARPLLAVDAEGRPRARPRDHVSPARRRAARRPDDAQAPRDSRGSEGGRDGSLLAELDATVTSIGSRLLRAWLLRPLVAIEPIRDRLDAVEELAFRATDRGKFRDAIKAVQDLERLVARAALGTAGPRDLVGLKVSLAVIPRVRTLLAELQAPLVRSLVAELDDLLDVRSAIEATLVDEPPALARDGGFTRDGVDARTWMSCAPSAARASRSSPRWKSASARARASPR